MDTALPDRSALLLGSGVASRQTGGRASGRKEFAVVVEKHDSVAEQAPALFWMRGYRAGRVPV